MWRRSRDATNASEAFHWKSPGSRRFWVRFLGMNGIRVNARLLDGLNKDWRFWEGAK